MSSKMNGYLLFCLEHKAKWKSEGKKVDVLQDLLRIGDPFWKGLSKDEQQVYKDMSKIKKANANAKDNKSTAAAPGAASANISQSHIMPQSKEMGHHEPYDDDWGDIEPKKSENVSGVDQSKEMSHHEPYDDDWGDIEPKKIENVSGEDQPKLPYNYRCWDMEPNNINTWAGFFSRTGSAGIDDGKREIQSSTKKKSRKRSTNNSRLATCSSSDEDKVVVATKPIRRRKQNRSGSAVSPGNSAVSGQPTSTNEVAEGTIEKKSPELTDSHSSKLNMEKPQSSENKGQQETPPAILSLMDRTNVRLEEEDENALNTTDTDGRGETGNLKEGENVSENERSGREELEKDQTGGIKFGGPEIGVFNLYGKGRGTRRLFMELMK